MSPASSTKTSLLPRATNLHSFPLLCCAASAAAAAVAAACLDQFERAAKEVLQEDHQLTSEGEEQAFEDVQVLLFSSQPFGPQGMRSITSARVSQLVQISGIVTSASKQKVSTLASRVSAGMLSDGMHSKKQS
jgi:DNA replicative helicase MCM subunit Mcm2 (Cdc46/Mcm family)